MPRDSSISIAKGLAIGLVVIGHLPSSPTLAPFYAYSFHMPLFFFLGGLLRRPESFEPPGQYVLGRLRRILVPFYGYYLGLAALSAVLGAITGAAFLSPYWYFPRVAFYNVFTVGGGVPLFFTGWFLTSYLVVSLLALPLHKISVKSRLAACLTVAGLAVAAVLSMRFGQIKDPSPLHEFINLAVCRNIVVLFFFWLGHLARPLLQRKFLFGTTALGSAFFLQYFVVQHAAGPVHFFTGLNIYYSLWLPFVTSLCGITFVLSLSFVIDRSGSGGWLARLGDRSLHIMALHPVAFQLVSLPAYLFAGEALSTASPPELYAPALLWPIYLTAGLVVPTLLAGAWDKLSPQILAQSRKIRPAFPAR